MFINCSNHSSEGWSEKQLHAAQQWGEVQDYPFPYVDPNASEEAIQEIACLTAEALLRLRPGAVMCQGEFTLTYAVVSRLKEQGITVVSACSERSVKEEALPDGGTQKVSQFQFVRFRRY